MISSRVGSPSINKAVPGELELRLAERIANSGGWMPFDAFMRAALYEPGLGYYTGAARKFGRKAGDGSDFVTAPELGALFGQALARQVAQITRESAPHVMEFGAGSGRLAADLLRALGPSCERYFILEVSGNLQAVQRATLERAVPEHAHKVEWLQAWPPSFSGCAVGNEVLDAMPVRLIERGENGWLERGVVVSESAEGAMFSFEARMGSASLQALAHERLPEAQAFPVGYQTELAEEAPAMVASLADTLDKGGALFIDYGFPQREFFHPQRAGGTLMCHEGHMSDTNPLVHVGRKDITAHVDFTAVALAGQDAGLDVLGYASQARFLINCGLLDLVEGADWKTLASAQTLIVEHEMGELFKVIGFTKGIDLTSFEPVGFSNGDRSHTL